MDNLGTLLPEVVLQTINLVGESVSIARGTTSVRVEGTNRMIDIDEVVWQGKAVKEYKDTLERSDYSGQLNRAELNSIETQHTQIRFYLSPSEFVAQRGDIVIAHEMKCEVEEVYTERIGDAVYYQTLHTRCMNN